MSSVDEVRKYFSHDLGEALEKRDVVDVVRVNEYPNIETNTAYSVRVKIHGQSYAIVRKKDGFWRAEDGDRVVCESKRAFEAVKWLVEYA